MHFYYIWLEGFDEREALTLYTDTVRAMEGARTYERFGFTVQVRNARSGELVAE